MGWGKKAQALTSAVAAARVAVAPRPDPRVAAELARTLSARATASCWVAMVIIPFTIVAYDGAYYPAQLTRGAIAAAAADALILALLIALRRHAFDQHPWLPFALLAGVICNVTEAVNLLLSSGRPLKQPRGGEDSAADAPALPRVSLRPNAPTLPALGETSIAGQER